jgi:tRNA threonylcarbamoyladenosine biosynthesis protein TsaB
MAIVLSIETSTSVCSVALHQDGKLLTTIEVHQEYSHASKLGILVNDARKVADIELKKINAVAISSGPGSYTGLRIGTSLAKGLCYALGVPLISVPTMQVMALMVSRICNEDVYLCPMIDARRMEVYCQIFDNSLAELEPVQAKVIDEKCFEHYLHSRPVLFFGNGAAKCKPVITHKNAKFLDDVNPLASRLGELAYSRFQDGKFEDVSDFAPLYLKEFLIKKPVGV